MTVRVSNNNNNGSLRLRRHSGGRSPRSSTSARFAPNSQRSTSSWLLRSPRSPSSTNNLVRKSALDFATTPIKLLRNKKSFKLRRLDTAQTDINGIHGTSKSINSLSSSTGDIDRPSRPRHRHNLKSCLKQRTKLLNVVPLPNLNLKRKKTSVKFHHEDEGRYGLGLHEYTDEEYNATYFQPWELQHSIAKCEKIASEEQCRLRSDSSNQKGYMRRGLESLIYAKQTSYRRQQGYAAILRNGLYDPNDSDIDLYILISEECLKDAQRIAIKDADFATRYQQDNNNNVQTAFEQSPKTREKRGGDRRIRPKLSSPRKHHSEPAQRHDWSSPRGRPISASKRGYQSADNMYDDSSSRPMNKGSSTPRKPRSEPSSRRIQQCFPDVVRQQSSPSTPSPGSAVRYAPVDAEGLSRPVSRSRERRSPKRERRGGNNMTRVRPAATKGSSSQPRKQRSEPTRRRVNPDHNSLDDDNHHRLYTNNGPMEKPGQPALEESRRHMSLSPTRSRRAWSPPPGRRSCRSLSPKSPKSDPALRPYNLVLQMSQPPAPSTFSQALSNIPHPQVVDATRRHYNVTTTKNGRQTQDFSSRHEFERKEWRNDNRRQRPKRNKTRSPTKQHSEPTKRFSKAAPTTNQPIPRTFKRQQSLPSQVPASVLILDSQTEYSEISAKDAPKKSSGGIRSFSQEPGPPKRQLSVPPVLPVVITIQEDSDLDSISNDFHVFESMRSQEQQRKRPPPVRRIRSVPNPMTPDMMSSNRNCVTPSPQPRPPPQLWTTLMNTKKDSAMGWCCRECTFQNENPHDLICGVCETPKNHNHGLI